MLNRRGSGVLLHISSLPSPYGIGDLGPGAYQFADFLSAGKQNFWQILPLTPTSEFWGNSPYSSPSAFAGNPLLVSPEWLLQRKLLSKSDLGRIPVFPRGKVDYRRVTGFKEDLFSIVCKNFGAEGKKSFAFQNFYQENSFWLEDYALFGALKEHFGGAAWGRWPRGARDREPGTIRALKEKLRDQVEKEIFLQYLFSRQWFSLKRFLNDRGIQVIGDAPIYVNYDSADVWANPEIFELDARKRPLYVAGIPPDYFSATGQLWGNPIYRWGVLKEKGYSWWIRRIGHNLKLFDFVRLDHFKGFVDFWEVPAKNRTAVKGRWVPGPKDGFFDALLKHFPSLPLIAEDLGVITAEVHRLRDRYGFPGMRVLQFAFGSDPLADLYKPIHYIKNCAAYTGTHDNDTLMGWLSGQSGHSTRTPDEIRRERNNVWRYLGLRSPKKKGLHWEVIRTLMMSPANLVIFPMQDLLGLGAEARMNRPGTNRGNWAWRLTGKQLTPSLGKRLGQMTEIYQRG
jgi:4-alpha-glucanotransferase